MVQPGIGVLDTPRTNVGDASYLNRQPDFDISQELSFQSPSKDTNVLQQLRDGGRPNLRTPRGNRAPFTDKKNLPAGLGGGEFTPLLKSATRNSARRFNNNSGKENGLATPAFLDRIDEDMTPMPVGESSVYGASRSASYFEHTPVPAVDASSAASTPMVIRRRGDTKGPLEEGNHLSLREQENVIDRIEKENFGLKLKIHFLEEALRKAGPGFSEAALKENTELKVDKVTMQRELHRYKKHLTSAEKDLESYRQQILELQDKAKRRFADESQRAEMDRLTHALEDKEAEIEHLQHQIAQEQGENDDVEKLQDDIGDLEAEVRRKDQIIGEYEDELDELRSKLDEYEDKAKEAEQRVAELEENARSSEELEQAKDTIVDLEADVRRLQQQLDEAEEKLEAAMGTKARAEADLEELQEEMSNKSVITKGLSRQVEEKVARLQTDLEQARQDYSTLAKQSQAKDEETSHLKSQVQELRQERESAERLRKSLATSLDEARNNLVSREEEKALLQARHDALTDESASLQRETTRLEKIAMELEENLEEERRHSLDVEHEIRNKYKEEIDRLNDEISDLQAECREKDNLYDNDSEKWTAERHTLESERERAEERAAGLQRTIDKLRAAENSLSDKETKLQEAIQSEAERHKSEEAVLARQISDLHQDLQSRQAMLEDLRNELSAVRDELRQSQLDFRAQSEKAEALEDEVEVLQATIDEESEKAHKELEEVRQQCSNLQKQLASLTSAASASSSASQETAKHSHENLARLRFQLADSTESLARITKEKTALQQQLATVNAELASVQATLLQTQAERDDLEGELAQLRLQGDDAFKVDREKLDLRSAKTRLDGEVRRLRDENQALMEQRRALEASLEDEIEKGATEEERLNREILDLQASIRQPGESQDLVSARRTIRELERRIASYEAQLAASQYPAQGVSGEGNSELSLLHRDLTTARHKELEMLQREASQRDTIKGLKRQIADLERKTHEAELGRLIVSPSSHSGSAQKAEVSELRHQLSAAHKSLFEFKRSLRDADQRAAATAGELQHRLEEVEEQKLLTEETLKDAQVAADEATANHERTLKKYKQKLDKYRRERDDQVAKVRSLELQQGADTTGSAMSVEERRDLHNMLKEAQIEADKLDREVREQREALDELMAVEMSLRKKLDRARSERAAYRASAEKLQKDMKKLQAAKEKADAAAAASNDRALAYIPHGGLGTLNNGDMDTGALIRGAEAAERRHEKEIRGMVMHMEWIKACWDREAKFRTDNMFVKQYLLKEVEIRDACNKADLAILNRIRAEINPKFRPAMNKLSFAAVEKNNLTKSAGKRPFRLQRLLNVVRFVVRVQISARNWAKHEALRQRLADAYDQQERDQRIRKMRNEWRTQMAQKKSISRPA